MKVLALDYSQKRTGVAIGMDGIIEPRSVITDGKQVLSKIKTLCSQEEINCIIVGRSEGKSASRAEKFAKELSNIVKLPVRMVDETLTTRDAKEIIRKTNGKKKSKIDSVAACLLLERFFKQ